MNTMMPIGFVWNTQEIYAEVASYPVVPPEKIKEYWTAYTTTFRRLSDPRAFRLENFWFHVWASERLRNLSGVKIAKLFEEFSNGPMLVPLPSYVVGKTYDGTKTSGPDQRKIGGQSSEAAQRHRDRPGQGSAPEIRKAPTPSSSRPPPPHPILKKTRGPSVSGRRPTARFVSPLCSGDEAGQDDRARPTSKVAPASEIPPPARPSSAEQNEIVAATAEPPASNETPSPQVRQSTRSPARRPVVSREEMRPPSRSPTATGRKIVATTAASRKKPVIVRRSSSQSSGGSESGSRMTGSVTSSTRSGPRRPVPTPSQLLGPNSLSPQTRDLGMSAKAAGKRSVKTAASNRPSPQGAGAQVRGHAEDDLVMQQAQLGPHSQQRPTWEARVSIDSQEGAQDRQTAVRLAPREQVSASAAGFVVDQTRGYGAPALMRSRSGNTAVPLRFREPGVAVLPSEATSSVATSTATARGQFDSETVTSEPLVPEARDIPDRVSSFGPRQYSSSVLHPRFTPTPPNPTPPIPFGRSRSELTLLLERAKPRRDNGS